LHQQNIEAALEASAFGVPTFITDTGELFFGQDRLPLLRHHLVARAGRPFSGQIGQM
jgi:2-hydroxychromene-2-carboxylate isomerase